MVIIEVAAFSAQWAIEAQKHGASRIELCADILSGGTTPSFGCIQLARENLKRKLFVMVRPRGGNFLYSDFEFETMARDIEQIKRIGADGVVLGLLNAKSQVDRERTRQLVKLAKPMEVTFHRAFDIVPNPFDALESIIEAGCNRILTSGQRANAVNGANLINQLKVQANGRIIILPGCGINSRNINSLVEMTNLNEYHLSSKKKITYPTIKTNPEVNFNLQDGAEDIGYELDVDELSKVIRLT